MARIPFKLYLVGDRRQTRGIALTQAVREAGEAGIRAFQFREKDLCLQAQYALALEIKKITRELGMHLFINGRVDLCLAIDAEGVQLPVDGFPIGIARRLLGEQKKIAVSCHNEEDVKRAEREGADFAVLGPVYDTPSKRRYGPPLGLNEFKRVKACTSIPVFAIGGINRDRLNEIIEAGADGVAMISAILSGENIGSRSRNILRTLAKF